MKYLISVIGNYSSSLNGQTIKTIILTDALKKKYGDQAVCTINTVGGFKTLLKLFFKIPLILRDSGNVVILPAHNAVRILTPLLSAWNVFFNKKLHYCVIGGWLPDFLNKRWLLSYLLKKFDGIYVETSTMKRALELQGFNNVLVMPNCKELTSVSEDELPSNYKEPYRLCTFSRVSYEKGIEDAICAVKAINEKNKRTVFQLDIYGQIDEGQRAWFMNLQDTFPEYIHYCGKVDFDKSVETIKNYFLLLFPTKAFTEGVPGTILDAYAAGVPVIASKWESFGDIVEDGVTGFGYEFASLEQLVSTLSTISNQPSLTFPMKKQCLIKFKEYSPDMVVNTLKIL